MRPSIRNFSTVEVTFDLSNDVGDCCVFLSVNLMMVSEVRRPPYSLSFSAGCNAYIDLICMPVRVRPQNYSFLLGRRILVHQISQHGVILGYKTVQVFRWFSAESTLLTLDTAPSHVKMCRWLTSYVPRSQFQVL